MDRRIIESRQRLITHADCADGIASAVIIAAALPGIEIVFCRYGDQQRALRPGSADLFCDFTPHADDAAAFRDAGAVVLDHHEGQRGIVGAFGDHGVYSTEYSGAMLAYAEVYEPMRSGSYEALEFAQLASIRDTWQRGEPRWGEACAQAAALLFYGPDRLIGRDPWLTDSQREVGSMLYENRCAEVRRAVDRVWYVGNVALLNNDGALTSDVAELLRANGSPASFLAGFSYSAGANGAPQIRFSLRSIADGFSVLRIAKANGGGGHERAAGFSVDAEMGPESHIIDACERAT